MNKISLTVIAILFATYCHSQTQQEKAIFVKILEENISDTKFYIGCEQSKTFFDSDNFNSQTGLEVPTTILEELVSSSNKSNGDNWHSAFPIKTEYVSQFLISENCLEKEDIEGLFKKSSIRRKVFIISKPIFDANMEHCIISFSCIRDKGSAYGNTYFLKKVYGSWTVIAVFDLWTS